MISYTEWLLANAQSSNPIPTNITMIQWCQHHFFKGKPKVCTHGNISIWGNNFSPFVASPLMEKNPIPTSPQMRITSIHNFKLFCWFNQGPLITGQVQVVTLLHSYESSLISYWTLKTAKIGSLESNFINFNSPKLISYFCYLSFYVSKLLLAPQLIIMQVH